MIYMQEFRKALICVAVLFVMPIYASSLSFFTEKDLQHFAEIKRDPAACGKLCVNKVLAHYIKASQIAAECLDVPAIHSGAICSGSIDTDSMCANTMNVTQQVCAAAMSTPALCADQITATNMCANGLVQVNQFQQCGTYRAALTFATDELYTLGSNVNFDTVLDDPNSNVTLSPTGYTAPLSGYYSLTTQIDSINLSGANPLLGTPVANLQILVNGNVCREVYNRFIAFHNEQNTLLNSLIMLNAGDVVSVVYNVYSMTDEGFAPYVGTVEIEGNNTGADQSVFMIHYLSSSCNQQLPCSPCQMTCSDQPCNLPCVSCSDCSIDTSSN